MKMARLKLKLKKHSPEILMVAGVAAIVGGVITACRSTLKVEDAIDDHKEKLDEIKSIPEEVNPIDNVEYPEEVQKADVAKLYLHTGLEFVKLYSVPLGLTVGGIVMLVTATNKYKKRYLGAVAAYNGVAEAFKKYRQAVIDKEGIDKDHEYLYGKGTKKTIEMKTVNDKGDEVYSKGQAVIFDQDGAPIELSGYAQFFARGVSTQWDLNEYYNRTFINGKQKYWTAILRDRGRDGGAVFLNEVLDDLGFKMTVDGSVVGWIINPADGVEAVDEIEFDVHEVWLPEVGPDGHTVHEPAYYIDFPNLSGIIFDKL